MWFIFVVYLKGSTHTDKRQATQNRRKKAPSLIQFFDK